MRKISYAHFPGKGPPGKFCNDCDYFRLMEKSRSRYFCSKAAEMSPGAKVEQITSAPACKYFDFKREKAS